MGLAIDAHDNLFVADAGNNKIKMITPDGLVTTLAGNGDYASDNGNVNAASFNKPFEIAVDKNDAVYVVGEEEANKVRKISFNYEDYLKTRLSILKVNDHHKIVDTSSFVNTIDTAKYIGIPYWHKKMEVFGPSYIDTFTEQGIKFRIVHQNIRRKGINLATVERYTKGKWIKRIEFEPLNHEGDFHHNKDVNNDGYNDITHELRFDSEVYFFNPIKKDFEDTASATINYGIFLIDTARNIFCDFQEYKSMCRQITSTLYTFNGIQKINLFQLEFYNCGNDDADTITKLILNKCINGSSDSLKEIKNTILKKPFSADKIDENFS